jgi:ATP-dependent Clp protease ATP-binding subunit ClpC
MEISPNFTPQAQKIIQQAKTLAKALNYEEVESCHVLLILLKSNDFNIDNFLTDLNINVDSLVSFINSFFSLEKQDSDELKDCSYSDELVQFLAAVHQLASQIGNDYVSIDHIFFCFLNSKNGPIYHFLTTEGVDAREAAEEYLVRMKSGELYNKNESVDPFGSKSQGQGSAKTNESILDSFATNLNTECRDKKINPIIGKDFEISRICEILARKNKNNPILLGEPGVGKTAIVEGLAYKITKADVPDFLINKEIYAIDLASMIAGTKYRGQFEQRVKSLIKECQEKPNVVLFIDEAHTLVGAGSAEGAMDAANILKPALARGKIKLIAATTFSEYKKNFEKDSALVRRFESIAVSEPTPLECFDILKGIKGYYEDFHGTKYNQKILKNIVNLCDLYLPAQKFPDKAIDVLDECGAMVKIANSTAPDEIKDLENKLYDCFSLNTCSANEEERLLKRYEKLSDDWKKAPIRNVSKDDILTIISRKSKIPIDNLIDEESDRASRLLKLLTRDVVNQTDATSAISKSILRSQIGLKDIDKPIGSFLFLGASGVGKTWTAKMLAKHYFGSEKKIIRFDMSEYSDKISANKLIGSSPGYVGYEEGGLLTEKIKRDPHSVVLFDEIEKADPSVQQILLQVMDEGSLKDNNGVMSYFSDAIIILTSNIGADLTTKSTLGFSPEPVDNGPKIISSAKKVLSPELINRLDDIVVFNHLKDKDLHKIFKKELQSMQKKLRKKKIKINYSQDVVKHVCSLAAEQKMGARPLKRLIKQYIEDVIVDYYFNTEIQKGLNFNFYVLKGDIEFELLE